jgi:hypothetical protein
MSWLNQHLETFVYPEIGEQKLPPLGYFTPRDLTLIKNAWKSFKKHAKNKTILLPGRDVFVFEILARRENYPTIFMPELSRKTVGYYRDNLNMKKEEVCIIDTGFAGSIPLGLGIKEFKMLSHNSLHSDIHIFPSLKMSRELALKIEHTPKYWTTAFMTAQGVMQVRSVFTEFVKAACLTVEVFTNSAPRFAPGRSK